MPPTMIHRVQIRNYKSIAACDVELRPLTFLVGPNGSGKSNFLDALRFVSDAVWNVEEAIQGRGGMDQILHRSADGPLAIRLFLRVPDSFHCVYSFEIVATEEGFAIASEHCRLESSDDLRSGEYCVKAGRVRPKTLPAADPHKLYLGTMIRHAGFAVVQFALENMALYTWDLKASRLPKTQHGSWKWMPDADNIVPVLHYIKESQPGRFERMKQFLSRIIPRIENFEPKVLGSSETVEFLERTETRPQRFLASSMSDGTVRALVILVALFQPAGSLIGLEEPEIALHPAAAGVLFDCLKEASDERQVLVASHSADLLDRDDLDPEGIRGAKERLKLDFKRYAETIDQPALSAKMDLIEARRAPLFARFWRICEAMFADLAEHLNEP